MATDGFMVAHNLSAKVACYLTSLRCLQSHLMGHPGIRDDLAGDGASTDDAVRQGRGFYCEFTAASDDLEGSLRRLSLSVDANTVARLRAVPVSKWTNDLVLAARCAAGPNDDTFGRIYCAESPQVELHPVEVEKLDGEIRAGVQVECHKGFGELLAGNRVRDSWGRDHETENRLNRLRREVVEWNRRLQMSPVMNAVRIREPVSDPSLKTGDSTPGGWQPPPGFVRADSVPDGAGGLVPLQTVHSWKDRDPPKDGEIVKDPHGTAIALSLNYIDRHIGKWRRWVARRASRARKSA